ncbi:MAG: GyrI-like domain-containing protein [Bacteroidetes bacterium]|nr:GyrI-like domain-containing protein [Bacteroidota bacterium]
MKFALAVVVILILAVLTTFFHYDMFDGMTVVKKTVPARILVYEVHQGDHKKSADAMNKVFFTLLKLDSIKTSIGFGLYYDNPEFTPKDSLRWIAGCILNPEDTLKIGRIADSFKVAVFPETEAVYTDFAYKGALSVFIGVYKAYPALGEYMAENKLAMPPVMELYDQPRNTIQYIAPVHLSKEQFDSYLK